MFKRHPGLVVGSVFTLAWALSACGDDRSAVSEESTPGEAAAACDAVGDGGGTPVEVELDEWSVKPALSSVAAGDVTFTVHNLGHEPHELVIVRAGSVGELTVVDGQIDERALPDGAFIGEVEAFPASTSCEGTFSLAPGSYVLFCNLLEEHDNTEESHYNNGMATVIEVT